MKYFLKISLITLLLSLGVSAGFKNYKNSLLPTENAQEFSAESKEKADGEKDDSFTYLSLTDYSQLTDTIGFEKSRNEKKLANFLEEVPTSPPNFSA